jgi:hypothetical protein
MAAASVPAFAEEGEAQSEGRDLLELLEEQGIRKDGDASELTIQGLGLKVANLDAGSASDANNKIKERTKQGFHITINMTADWNNQTIEIPSGADVTIKMNGHTINRNRTSGGRNDSAIQVGSNALLSIDGGTRTSFKGMRIYSTSGKLVDSYIQVKCDADGESYMFYTEYLESKSYINYLCGCATVDKWNENFDDISAIINSVSFTAGEAI